MLPLNKYAGLFLCCCFVSTICFGQKQKGNARFRFQSINAAGLVNGEAGPAFQVQTINGIQHKSWFGGIGVGMDFYRFRSIPVFADLRKTFGHGSNKPFVYADGGISCTWATDKEKGYYANDSHFSNGLYLDGGMGYEIHISGKNALLLSVGYSYKKVADRFPTFMPYPLDYMPNVQNPYGSPGPTNTYNYYLHRISIKIGWAF